MWKFRTDEEKSNFVRDPPLVNALNQGNWDIAKLKAIDRIVEYIHGHEADTLKRLLFYGFRSHEHDLYRYNLCTSSVFLIYSAHVILLKRRIYQQRRLGTPYLGWFILA
jgi:hypothetical protein